MYLFNHAIVKQN